MGDAETVNGKQLARILGITAGRVSQLKTAGVLSTSGSPPRFDLAESVQAYISYSVDNAMSRAPEDSDAERKKLRAEADYKEARARQEEIRLAELEGRMHSAEDVEAATTALRRGVIYPFRLRRRGGAQRGGGLRDRAPRGLRGPRGPVAVPIRPQGLRGDGQGAQGVVHG